jgi:predicted nucleic acid-binding protein
LKNVDATPEFCGLVDCFSFVVMKEARLKVALSFDEHFRQAGFEAPLLAG